MTIKVYVRYDNNPVGLAEVMAESSVTGAMFQYS